MIAGWLLIASFLLLLVLAPLPLGSNRAWAWAPLLKERRAASMACSRVPPEAITPLAAAAAAWQTELSIERFRLAQTYHSV